MNSVPVKPALYTCTKPYCTTVQSYCPALKPEQYSTVLSLGMYKRTRFNFASVYEGVYKAVCTKSYSREQVG
jgi:hypothetical protein